MNAEDYSVEVGLALDLIIRGMVDEPEKLTIVPVLMERGTIEFQVTVTAGDIGKVIGIGGRNAKSLRTLLFAISRCRKHSYTLDIRADGANFSQ